MSDKYARQQTTTADYLSLITYRSYNAPFTKLSKLLISVLATGSAA